MFSRCRGRLRPCVHALRKQRRGAHCAPRSARHSARQSRLVPFLITFSFARFDACRREGVPQDLDARWHAALDDPKLHRGVFDMPLSAVKAIKNKKQVATIAASTTGGPGQQRQAGAGLAQRQPTALPLPTGGPATDAAALHEPTTKTATIKPTIKAAACKPTTSDRRARAASGQTCKVQGMRVWGSKIVFSLKQCVSCTCSAYTRLSGVCLCLLHGESNIASFSPLHDVYVGSQEAQGSPRVDSRRPVVLLPPAVRAVQPAPTLGGWPLPRKAAAASRPRRIAQSALPHGEAWAVRAQAGAARMPAA